MKPVDWASIYGCIRDFEPAGGIWKIHKHMPSGELLGPSVKFGTPTRMVYARQTEAGWVEISTMA